MPSALDSAKEATYTAIGLNVLFFDELSERLSTQREQVNERFSSQRDQVNERFTTQRDQLNTQLDIARDHAKSARSRMVPVARRTWEAAEPTVTRISDLTPAPFDNYMTDGIAKVREFVGAEGPSEVVADETPTPKTTTKKATASKK